MMPIRNTLSNSSLAVFSVLLPNANIKDMPCPSGTGFFISPDGWFVTAAHVVMQDGKIRKDIGKGSLEKERVDEVPGPGAGCQFLSLEFVDEKLDLALLKVDFDKNKNKAWLEGKNEFPYITVSTRKLSVGEPVYSFGYPLSNTNVVHNSEEMIVAVNELCPRATSAIVSSTLEKKMMVTTPNDPQVYILDKALNYGNSGGPIIAVETGNVHAVCMRFQPVYIPQGHIKNPDKSIPFIMIPSLYGVVSSLGNNKFLEKCNELGIPLIDE